MKHIFKIGLATVLIVGGTAAAVWGWIQWRYDRSVVTDIAAAPEMPVAIVFGAGIRADGPVLSPMLADRMDTAIDLYNAGKVRKLLVSGDNRFVDYDEPGRMYDYAVARGVLPADVVRDYAGRRTYDTCYRAKAVFGVERALRHATLPSAAGHLHLPQPGGGRHRLFGGSPALLVEQLLPLPRRLRHPARGGRQDRPPAAGAGAVGGTGPRKLES